MLVIELTSTDSTNSEAKRLVQSSQATSSVIFAHSQTAGRGRYGRQWESGHGNLYMSILIPLKGALDKAAELSFVIGVATHDILSSIINNAKIQLKWPNDIFIDGKKLGGILLESITHENQTWIIIGLGLNLLSAPLPDASCLKDYGINIAPRRMLDLIIPEFEKFHQIWKLTGMVNIARLWSKHAYKLGKQVNVGDDKTRFTGIFESIDESGAMILRMGSGEERRMFIGEMFF